MTPTDERQDHLIRLLAPEIALPDTAPAADDLRRRIMASAPPAERRRVPWPRRFRLAIALPVAAALAAVAVVVATAAMPTTSPVGPAPAQAETLRIATGEDYLTVTIVDPTADPARYRAELAEHGLDIKLSLAPAEPDQIGRIIFREEDDAGGPPITTIEAPGNCTANGNCSVGLRVPLRYAGHASIVFGRTPKPNEEVAGDAPVLSADKKKQLEALIGERVADVRATLDSRGQTATYRVGARELEAPESEVPGDWYVYDVAPLAGGVVVLWVSADGKQPR